MELYEIDDNYDELNTMDESHRLLDSTTTKETIGEYEKLEDADQHQDEKPVIEQHEQNDQNDADKPQEPEEQAVIQDSEIPI